MTTVHAACFSKNAISSLRRSLRLIATFPALIHGVNLENGLGGIQADHGNAHSRAAPFLPVLTTRTLAH